MAIARTKNVGISDYKLRLVMDQIRGKMVNDAVPVLRYLTSPAAAEILKILNAAFNTNACFTRSSKEVNRQPPRHQ